MVTGTPYRAACSMACLYHRGMSGTDGVNAATFARPAFLYQGLYQIRL